MFSSLSLYLPSAGLFHGRCFFLRHFDDHWQPSTVSCPPSSSLSSARVSTQPPGRASQTHFLLSWTCRPLPLSVDRRRNAYYLLILISSAAFSLPGVYGQQQRRYPHRLFDFSVHISSRRFRQRTHQSAGVSPHANGSAHAVSLLCDRRQAHARAMNTASMRLLDKGASHDSKSGIELSTGARALWRPEKNSGSTRPSRHASMRVCI